MRLLDIQTLSETDAYTITAFRRAAGEVYRLWWPVKLHEFRATILAAGKPDTAALTPEADFRSLLIAMRQVYMAKEASHIEKVERVLATINDSEIASAVSVVRQDWNRALEARGSIILNVDDAIFSPRAVLDTYLYATVLHQDKHRQQDLDRLRQADPIASLALQLVVCDLSRCIVNLDNVVAYALGEEGHNGQSPPVRGSSNGLF